MPQAATKKLIATGHTHHFIRDTKDVLVTYLGIQLTSDIRCQALAFIAATRRSGRANYSTSEPKTKGGFPYSCGMQ